MLRSATTDDFGSYLFSDLQPGIYKVTYAATSFGTQVQDNIQILANTVRRIDVTLQVAQVTVSVLVKAAAAVLQTDRADVNNQLQSGQIVNLPFTGNAGRNWQALYKIIPGFAPPAELHSDAGNPRRALGANVNGASRSNNNTKLDGATVSYPWLPHIVAYVPPADAVETVNVVTNERFHGSAQRFHTNSAVKARHFFFVGSGLPKRL